MRFITVVSCRNGESGLYGNTYKLPTLYSNGKPFKASAIRFFVDCMLEIAAKHPDWIFQVSRFYSGAKIAAAFQGAPPNVLLPGEW